MCRLVLVADASPVAAAQLVAQAFGEGDADELLGERAARAARGGGCVGAIHRHPGGVGKSRRRSSVGDSSTPWRQQVRKVVG